MAWKERCVMDERVNFIADLNKSEWSMAELCRRYGISRETGYKWKRRYELEGARGLHDRSRAPLSHPHRVGDTVIGRIVERKGEHPTWGPRKIVASLERDEPGTQWPAVSTVSEILDRHGLVKRRKKRRKATPSTQPLAHCVAPNDVWCIDFKGWFLTQNGTRCDPLTLCDGDTRFFLKCQALSGNTDTQTVQAVLDSAFREYGLPRAIRSDNGTPFASTGRAGLSRLSVWWMRLGITPERIRPGHPEENGRLERLHKTLKAETAKPPRHTLRQQQQTFNRFRELYNHERPHEALEQKTPGELYVPSPRVYTGRLPAHPEYDHMFQVRTVNCIGCFKWKGNNIYLTAALKAQRIGLLPIDDSTYELYFNTTLIGTLNENTLKIKEPKPVQ